jgi:hypothetical protein
VALDTPHGYLGVGLTLRELGKYVWTVAGLFQKFIA